MGNLGRASCVCMARAAGFGVITAFPAQVRPAAIEASAMKVPCSGSVTQHLLTAYLNSMLMVILAQFCSKSLIGGAIGGFCILQSHPPWRVKPLPQFIFQSCCLDAHE